jgi:hypothetical protein
MWIFESGPNVIAPADAGAGGESEGEGLNQSETLEKSPTAGGAPGGKFAGSNAAHPLS